MARSIKLIVYGVRDLEKARVFYTTFLGTEPYADSPYYVGYRVDDQEIGLDPHSTAGPIAYTDVSDIKSSLQAMVEAGGEVLQDVREVVGGLLIAQVKDGDGNVVGLRERS